MTRSPGLTGLFGSTIVRPPIATRPSTMSFLARLRPRSSIAPASQASRRVPPASSATIRSTRLTGPFDTMASSSFDDDEKPLDPAMLRVQAKMRRLMLIAGLTLGLGILVVFAAILYKIAIAGDKAPLATAWRPGDAVPTAQPRRDGAAGRRRLVSTASDGRRLILTYDEPGGGSALVFIDLGTLKVSGRLDLSGAVRSPCQRQGGPAISWRPRFQTRAAAAPFV